MRAFPSVTCGNFGRAVGKHGAHQRPRVTRAESWFTDAAAHVRAYACSHICRQHIHDWGVSQITFFEFLHQLARIGRERSTSAEAACFPLGWRLVGCSVGLRVTLWHGRCCGCTVVRDEEEPGAERVPRKLLNKHAG